MLTHAGKDAFQDYLNKGGNFVGIHAATHCLKTTAFYEREIGAYFDYHPDIQEAVRDLSILAFDRAYTYVLNRQSISWTTITLALPIYLLNGAYVMKCKLLYQNAQLVRLRVVNAHHGAGTTFNLTHVVLVL